MSRTETHIGKLVPTGLTMNEYIHTLPPKKRPNQDDLSWMTLEEWFQDKYHDKILILDGNVWKIEDKDLTDEDVSFSIKSSDGSIDYVVQYYNGCTSFEEAIKEAIKHGN